MSSNAIKHQQHHYQQQMNPTMKSSSSSSNRKHQLADAADQASNNYRQSFDPYSIYSDEDDVWYSEERLFEDHLEEIFNKWRLLDDDIWCKLIIMERNRRIGKAYARVPMVTIDGSHELSYDGYKLALNGFDNPDRDPKTEECRKRIGKGIRIKMDAVGNILIRRLSKSNVYIKEWMWAGGGDESLHQRGGRLMPSRQQLIKNQDAMTDASGQHRSATASSATPSSSSSAGSSLEPANDSAICDEVINVGGRLDSDRIYVMFDMTKFKANVTQELCRPYPDKRKLEQQCFSIIGLARDADDILNLPCWVMVINIVAIQMLNERFPLMTHHHTTSFPDTMLLGAEQHSPPFSRRQPNFVSIFEKNNNRAAGKQIEPAGSNKEEDPYSLPANSSCSDIKSSVNDYGQRQPSRYAKREQLFRGREQHHHGDIPEGMQLENYSRHKSRSNCNIYGPPKSGRHSNSSIYSPGHMLVQPQSSGNAADSSVPPKLPPRDFVKKTTAARSKSSSNVSCASGVNKDALAKSKTKANADGQSIYSTGLQLENQAGAALTAQGAKKTKKNKFLESLKAPLELAKSSSAHRSASVLGSPVQQQVEPGSGISAVQGDKKTTGSKNLRALLGGSRKSSKAGSDDSSNYVHVGHQKQHPNGPTKKKSGAKDNSVAQRSTQLADRQSPTAGSLNDLDIPTPDYETDENIYALDDGYAAGEHYSRTGTRSGGGKLALKHNKEDLYYSGFRAHVPHGICGHAPQPSRSAATGKMLDERMSRESGRFQLSNNNNARAGSLADSTGQRYRSASMQRYYTRSRTGRGSQSEIYEFETESPYAMSGGDLAAATGYGLDCDPVSALHRRRSGSKLGAPFEAPALHRVASSIANSNYDIGRSSSGIYGNNSSSASSDYADWHPQMRKVNSSGYLNSIFKNHNHQLASPCADSPLGTQFNQSACESSGRKRSSNKLQQQQQQQQQHIARSYASAKNPNSAAKPAATLSKQQQPLKQEQANRQAPSSVVNGQVYRSYDSSNDSEPSYTNSSDGLDIYDQIGALTRHGGHQNQFLDMHIGHGGSIATEAHVGEWENMYDR